jgi:acyl-CoA hydrolase
MGGRLPTVDPRHPSRSRSELTRWMGIQDANTAGNVHGGTIMKLCEVVAGIAAIRHSGTRVVTAGMDRMTFLHAVLVGNLVICLATVNAAWRTSMEVGVRVQAEDIRTGDVTHTSTAYLTMVALGEDDRPVEVPPLEPETEEEHRREREAQLRRNNRLGERNEIVSSRASVGR